MPREAKPVPGQEELIKIIEDMNRLRKTNIKEQRIPNESKNEYLLLTERLAGIIEENEEIKPAVNSVVGQMKKDASLLFYDYSQESFWKKLAPEMTDTLDRLVIQLKRDSFTGLSEKQHLMNAFKYISTKDEDLKMKLKMYDTILPFTNPKEIKNKQALIEKIGLGDVEGLVLEGNTVKVENPKHLNALVKQAGFLGFNKVNAVVSLEEHEKENYKGQIKGRHFENGKLSGFWRTLVKYTMPVSYPIIGSLPYRLQARIADYLTDAEKVRETTFCELRPGDRIMLKGYLRDHTDYDLFTLTTEAEEGALGEIKRVKSTSDSYITSTRFKLYTKTSSSRMAETGDQKVSGSDITTGHFGTGAPNLSSSILELTFGAAAILYAAITTDPSAWYYVAGSAMAAEGLFRIIGFRHSAGLVLTKLPLWPFEKLLFNNPEKYKYDTEFIVRDNDFTPDDTAEVAGVHNHTKLLENLAAKEMPEKIEKNLIWSLENHHTQAQYFSEEMQLHGMKRGQAGFKREEYVSKDNNSWAMYDIHQTGQYKKISALICMPNNRFTLTYITKNWNDSDIEKISDRLAEKKTMRKKAEDIFQMADAEYLQMAEYRQAVPNSAKTKTDDFLKNPLEKTDEIALLR